MALPGGLGYRGDQGGYPAAHPPFDYDAEATLTLTKREWHELSVSVHAGMLEGLLTDAEGESLIAKIEAAAGPFPHLSRGL